MARRTIDYSRVSLPAGTVIGMRFGPFEHIGIVTDTPIAGVPGVISNSRARGGVCEESLAAFAEGKPFRVLGYTGSLPGDDVVRRARTMIGRRYKPLRFNCEHFVRLAHGLRARSPQIETVAVLLAGAFAAWRLAR